MGGDLEFAAQPLPNEDDDVREERRRVVAASSAAERRQSSVEDDVVRVVGLRQEFAAPWEQSGKKVAVQNLCLGVQASTCLGFLGHNVRCCCVTLTDAVA